MPLDTLLDGLCFGEGPRWHDGRLWLSDMHAHTVLTVDLDGKREDVLARRGQALGPRLARRTAACSWSR